MKLSTKGRYGLKAMIDIAENSTDEVVSIRNISDRQNLSERYLEQLLNKLKKAGLVNSTRGANGGYTLARSADSISVGEILRATEGDMNIVECMGNDPDSECDNSELCVSRFIWNRINSAIENAVDTVFLSDLVNKSAELKANHNKGV